MYRRGPNPLADMDRGVHIRGESKSAVTPDEIWDRSEIRPFSPPVYTRICPVRGSQIRQSGSVVLVCLHGRISDRSQIRPVPCINGVYKTQTKQRHIKLYPVFVLLPSCSTKFTTKFCQNIRDIWIHISRCFVLISLTHIDQGKDFGQHSLATRHESLICLHP